MCLSVRVALILWKVLVQISTSGRLAEFKIPQSLSCHAAHGLPCFVPCFVARLQSRLNCSAFALQILF